jgi:phosphate:Na+ symporter
MVGAGVVKMENALALMLGSNVGTTLNSWILATLGFNYNIELFVLPVAGIAGIGMAFSSKESKFYFWCKFFFSLAFLFVAMGFIKSGMEAFVQQTNLTAFNRYPVVVFLLLGIFLTALVQSGSVTIALTLSALYSNAISLYVAMAIVLGAEIGTTLKLFLASAKGVAVKKRVATGNFLFNLLTVIIIFFLLQPIHYGLVHLLKIRDHLIALVFFQTFVNIVSLMLFFPFLHLLGRFLLKHFEDNGEGGFYISKLPIAGTTLAMDALENETRIFICDVVDFSLESFSQEEQKNLIKSVHRNFHRKTIAEKYEFIKKVHGEMHTYYLGLQKASTDKKETERLEQLISAIRNCMYAAKSIQDAQHDIEQVRNSSNDIKFGFYKDAGNKMLEFHRQILAILNRKPPGIHIFEDIAVLYRSITAGYADSLQLLYKESLATKVSEIEI